MPGRNNHSGWSRNDSFSQNTSGPIDRAGWELENLIRLFGNNGTHNQSGYDSLPSIVDHMYEQFNISAAHNETSNFIDPSPNSAPFETHYESSSLPEQTDTQTRESPSDAAVSDVADNNSQSHVKVCKKKPLDANSLAELFTEEKEKSGGRSELLSVVKDLLDKMLESDDKEKGNEEKKDEVKKEDLAKKGMTSEVPMSKEKQGGRADDAARDKKGGNGLLGRPTQADKKPANPGKKD